MSTWLIAGAGGGIATAVGRELAARGHRLVLADRPEMADRVARNADDLQARYGCDTVLVSFDATDHDRRAGFIDEVEEKAGALDGVVWTVGVMWDQEEMQSDGPKARLHHDINYTAAMEVLGTVAEKFEGRKRGQIVAIGSPAGDRGRQSNYLYGADKAALHVFLQGLRQRLAKVGINVITVKPGPTRTPMTDGMDKLPLPSTPERVAADIARAIDKRAEVVYTPWFWRYIMIVIRHIPEMLFKRVKM